MALALKPENIVQLVFFVRGEKVMFDADLAKLMASARKHWIRHFGVTSNASQLTSFFNSLAQRTTT